MITLEQFWMGRDVKYADELTEIIRANAQITVDKVNQLLERADPGKPHVVRSGWRPRAVNEATSNAAATSKHLSGEAADIADDDRALADWCSAGQHDLIELGLWCEDFRWTPALKQAAMRIWA